MRSAVKFRKGEEMNQKILDTKVKQINFRIAETFGEKTTNYKELLIKDNTKEKADIETIGFVSNNSL